MRAGCRFTDNLSGRPTFTELEGGTNEDVAYWYEVASIKKFKFRTSTEIYIYIYIFVYIYIIPMRPPFG